MHEPRTHAFGMITSTQPEPSPQRQLAAMQLSANDPQSLSQAPQWSTLVVTLVQMPVQQRDPAAHEFPQTPQFISVFVVVQVPEQQL